ncbi:MAG: copper amine oxidase N-terminal domain-containing protein, partial [Caldiserica bacterium]|nr:copper amine oxidase N-terminal domain-containing protein [Caldisericota bacterium]
SINIVAVDEAGNTSFEPPLTINYNPVSQPTLTITAPQNNSEVTGEVKLVPKATKGEYYIEGSTSIVASIDGDIVKVEVSSDTAPTEWIQLTIDSLLKKVTGTPGLKLKAGVNVLTFRVTDSSGKQYMFTRTVVANVSIRFDNIKSFNTKTGKLPIPTPDKSSYNGVAFKTTDGAYPFITQDGRTVLPFRLMGNAFGMKVSWDAATMTASFEFEGTTLKLKQGSNMATIIKNGVPTTRQIDLTNKNVVPVNVGGRLYVPARFITDVFGFPAPYWNGTTRTVMLCYPAACKP